MKKINCYQSAHIIFYLSILLLFGCSSTKLPVETLIDEISSCKEIVNKYPLIPPTDSADVKKYLQWRLAINAQQKIQNNKVWLRKLLNQGRVEDFKKLDEKINDIK